MMIFKKTESICEQIAQSIRENIIDDIWREGERIPSVRNAASEMQVNPNTVMRTYTLLQEEGLLFNKRGLGFYVSQGAKENILSKQKRHFFESNLPELFKSMKLLDISWLDLKKEYDNYSDQ